MNLICLFTVYTIVDYLEPSRVLEKYHQYFWQIVKISK